jgi:hypothetical protein
MNFRLSAGLAVTALCVMLTAHAPRHRAGAQRGVDVWADQYPYPTSGTDGSTVLIPNWAVRGAGQPQGGGRGAGPGQSGGSRADALRATLADPYSEGVEYVFVNGVAVVDAFRITWALPGRVITR